MLVVIILSSCLILVHFLTSCRHVTLTNVWLPFSLTLLPHERDVTALLTKPTNFPKTLVNRHYRDTTQV